MARKLELLSPARNADIGIEAINCGADAVYIGGPVYGARSMAANSVEDIRRLTEYAHIFGARVYVTLNTILYDEELAPAQSLAESLSKTGVDALIVQDYAFLGMGLDIPLHASTQMDNRTVDKVRLLGRLGFGQVVLARELGLDEIREIHAQCPEVTLEAFVHGALCVSYSGKCYASQYCFGRSANRGECAQFCRLPFDLEDKDGNVIVSDKHLLSLKDMNRSMHIEDMADAGVCSFKIEGRLKDLVYVKNVTSYYRKIIDDLISRRPDEYQRSSNGCCETHFEPDLNKTFNRGYTGYYLLRRREDALSQNSPKSVGEPVGKVAKKEEGFITVDGEAVFHNGDGLCFFDENDKLCGCRVNRVAGDKLFLHPFPKEIKVHTLLFRNKNVQFENDVEKNGGHRFLRVSVVIRPVEGGFRLCAETQGRYTAELDVAADKELAHSPQRERIAAELRKCALPYFSIDKAVVDFDRDYFIPMSALAQWRRKLYDILAKKIASCNTPQKKTKSFDISAKIDGSCLEPYDYTMNISNRLARRVCSQKFGITVSEPALENIARTGIDRPIALMKCRHCLRYAFGQCKRDARKTGVQKKHWPRLPNELRLSLPDGRKFPLSFDCQNCEMTVKSC